MTQGGTGTARHAWHANFWHGTARCEPARFELARHGTLWPGTFRIGTAQHVLAWHVLRWHGTARCNLARLELARHGTLRIGTARHVLKLRVRPHFYFRFPNLHSMYLFLAALQQNPVDQQSDD